MDTKHGPTVEGYAGVRVNYTAQFRKPDLDRQIKQIEQEIDRLRDSLTYDANTTRSMMLISRRMTHARPGRIKALTRNPQSAPQADPRRIPARRA